VLVADPSGLAAVIAAIEGAAVVAFDLEFDTRDRLVPRLCLVQVACVQRSSDAAASLFVALVDPLAVEVAPLIAAIAAHPRVIAHAPRQDLGLLAARFPGVAFPGLVDTQLMAAFAGMGEQLGLAALVRELCGAVLDKDQQWTQWARRPLSDAQLRYAADDVRYLPAIEAALAARLGPRVAWARDETARIGRDAVESVVSDPADAWRDVGGVRGLGERELGALRALAAWRLEVARSRDLPLGAVLPDKLLVELARARPVDADAVRAVRGLPEPARGAAEELAERVAGAPPVARTFDRPPSPRAQRWAEVLLAIANVVADEAGIAARLLATRADAEAFARGHDEGGDAVTRALPAATTWRRELLLPAWDGFLAGRLAVAVDVESPHGVRLTGLPAPATG
jgi:ribonuclease D